MNSRYHLYPAFKKDVQRLIEETGPNEYLSALLSSTRDRQGLYSWHSQQRLVDRIDDTLKDNHLWKCIKTSYRLRGTWKNH